MDDEYRKILMKDMESISTTDSDQAFKHIGIGVGVIVDHLLDVLTDSDWFMEKVMDAMDTIEREGLRNEKTK